MKKIKFSLAALTLIIAIAGTTTANATKSQDAPPCSVADPNGDFCLNQTDPECCQDDFTGEIRTSKIILPNN